MADIDNRNNLQFSHVDDSKSSKKKQSPIVSGDFKKFYNSMQAERKSVDQLKRGGGIEKALSAIEDAEKFATALLLSSAKHPPLLNEDGSGSNQASEMMQTASGIAGMQATKANLLSQQELIDAQKNPAIDLMSLKGKMVDYGNSIKDFYGEKVKYDYNISHNKDLSNVTITNKITIYDENNKVVKNVVQAGMAGNNSFIWDDADNLGNEASYGKYKISIESMGEKYVDGNQVSMSLTPGITLSGVVEKIKVERGTATGVVINGNVIARNQITDVRDVEKDNTITTLDASLVGKAVELDFARAKIISGNMDVYFNNHVEESGDLSVRIYDDKNKCIKILTSEDPVRTGVNKVSFENVGIKDGNYNIRTFVKNIEDQDDIKISELNHKMKTIVQAVNERKGSITSEDNHSFSAYNIDSIIKHEPNQVAPPPIVVEEER